MLKVAAKFINFFWCVGWQVLGGFIQPRPVVSSGGCSRYTRQKELTRFPVTVTVITLIRT